MRVCERVPKAMLRVARQYRCGRTAYGSMPRQRARAQLFACRPPLPPPCRPPPLSCRCGWYFFIFIIFDAADWWLMPLCHFFVFMLHYFHCIAYFTWLRRYLPDIFDIFIDAAITFRLSLIFSMFSPIFSLCRLPFSFLLSSFHYWFSIYFADTDYFHMITPLILFSFFHLLFSRW